MVYMVNVVPDMVKLDFIFFLDPFEWFCWTIGRYLSPKGVRRLVGKNLLVGIDLYWRHFYRQIVGVGVTLCWSIVSRYKSL